ncbi:MAG TPA: bifunctional 5,10-methylenetetrahydrofolate dehydrogenase/5,10-methenyltetrahydrofolate cyclohydrolase [Anaerolineae bacterium]
MTATILDGRTLAKSMGDEVEAEVKAFAASHGGVQPALVVLRAGEDRASVSYANALEKSFAKRGLACRIDALPETASEAEILAHVARLNADKTVHGIMVQEPLPRGVNEAAVKEAIAADKDVDGVNPVNAGRLAQAEPAGRGAGAENFFVPATPAGGMEILKRAGVPLQGKLAVVVGRSAIVGKPMALLLLRENATVIICHSRTDNLAGICRTADILCGAVGRARMIKADWIKPGAAVIDFGVNFVDGVMCGDVDYEAALEVAGSVTPVPGGTGPMTNIMLMKNVIAAAGRVLG